MDVKLSVKNVMLATISMLRTNVISYPQIVMSQISMENVLLVNKAIKSMLMDCVYKSLLLFLKIIAQNMDMLMPKESGGVNLFKDVKKFVKNVIQIFT